MNTFQKRFFNSLILLGLIVVIVFTNATPMFLIRFQSDLGGSVKWFLAAAYAAVVIFFITWLWKWYQKGVDADQAKQKMSWKDVGIILLFYLAGRVVAVAGTVMNQLVSGNQMSMNDQAIFGLTAGLKEGFLPFTICFLLVIGIVAPIIEELVFRGLSKKKQQETLITTYCGLDCTGCEWREPCNCNGCVSSKGFPFHCKEKACPIASCAINRDIIFCGMCKDFPCQLLIDYSCDKEHGDTPSGARIEACRLIKSLLKK